MRDGSAEGKTVSISEASSIPTLAAVSLSSFQGTQSTFLIQTLKLTRAPALLGIRQRAHTHTHTHTHARTYVRTHGSTQEHTLTYMPVDTHSLRIELEWRPSRLVSQPRIKPNPIRNVFECRFPLEGSFPIGVIFRLGPIPCLWSDYLMAIGYSVSLRTYLARHPLQAEADPPLQRTRAAPSIYTTVDSSVDYFQMNRLVVWSIKCQKMVENVNQCFPKPKMTSLNVLFCPQPKHIQSPVI